MTESRQKQRRWRTVYRGHDQARIDDYAEPLHDITPAEINRRFREALAQIKQRRLETIRRTVPIGCSW